MTRVTVMVVSSIFKNCSNFLRKTFYTSLYTCILQNMKHGNVCVKYFLRVVQNIYIERFTISFINNQEINLNLLLALI